MHILASMLSLTSHIPKIFTACSIGFERPRIIGRSRLYQMCPKPVPPPVESSMSWLIFKLPPYPIVRCPSTKPTARQSIVRICPLTTFMGRPAPSPHGSVNTLKKFPRPTRKRSGHARKCTNRSLMTSVRHSTTVLVSGRSNNCSISLG